MEICRLKGVDMGEDLEKFIEKHPTYIEALEMLEQKDQRITELEQELAKYKDLQDRLGLENVDEFEWFVMLDLLTDNEKNMHILDLHRELAALKEKAIVPKFSSGQIVYFANIVEGTVNKFNYIGEDKYNYVVEDKTGEVFIRMKERTFATEQEAQEKLKENNMKEYQKIETLYKFDNELKGYREEFYNPIVEYLKDCKWIGTEKIDGTNTRVLWNGHNFEFGGRTDKAVLPKELLQLLQDTFNYDMEVLFEQKFGEKEVLLFMEGYAGKIQKGAYQGTENIIGFDIMIDGIYLDKKVSQQIFEDLAIKFVPIIEFNNLQECIDFVINHKQSIIQPESQMEGLVCYPAVRLYDHQGNRIIVKIKNKDLNKLVN